MKHSFLQPAFTLVELIVVITILAILGTIGFVSLQGYSVNARDSVRIADTKTFLKALNIYQTKNGEVPFPDDMTTITGSGVVFSYQGTLSGSVIAELGQGQVPLDPLLKTPYLYATNEGRTKVQLLSYHEKNTSSLELQNTFTHAETTHADMFPKVIGDEIGILLTQSGGGPSPGLFSLESHQNTELKLLISADEGSRDSFEEIYNYLNFGNKNETCLRMLENSKAKPESGLYQLFDTGTYTWFEAYCDMETDGGGWTILASDAGSDFSTSLNDINTTPSKLTPGLQRKLLALPMKDLAQEMRVVNIDDESDFANYPLVNSILSSYSLSKMEYGYLYSENIGFTGGENGAHKCNFSIIVLGAMGCTETFSASYPADGKTLGAVRGNSYSTNTPFFSWNFRDGSDRYRIGWIKPTGYPNYYNERDPAYLMVR